MNRKLTLAPEHLRVDSFPTGELPQPIAPGIVTTVPQRTCPECANTGPYATCF